MDNRVNNSILRTINLRHMFWSFLEKVVKKWKLILIVSIIGALLGAGYAVLKNFNEKKTDITVSKSISVTEEEFAHVYKAAQIYDSLNEQQEYNDNSLWMKCNDFSVFSTTVICCIETSDDKEKIAAMYMNEFEGYDLYEKVQNGLNENIDIKFLKEVFDYVNLQNGLLKITVNSYSVESAETMINSVKEYLAAYENKINEQLDIKHKMTILSMESVERIDSSLREKKAEMQTALTNLKIQYDNELLNLSKNEQDYLNLYLEKRNEDGYTAGEDITLTDNDLNRFTGSVQDLRRIKIDSVLGLCLGIVMVLGYFIVEYCWSSVLIYGKELTGMYGIPVMGYFQENNVKTKSEQWFLKKKGYVVNDSEAECEEMISRLCLQMKENEKIYLLNNIESFKEYNDILKMMAEKRKISVICINSIYEISSLELENNSRLLLTEKEMISKYDEIEKEMNLCKEAKIDVCGFIVVL